MYWKLGCCVDCNKKEKTRQGKSTNYAECYIVLR